MPFQKLPSVWRCSKSWSQEQNRKAEEGFGDDESIAANRASAEAMCCDMHSVPCICLLIYMQLVKFTT